MRITRNNLISSFEKTLNILRNYINFYYDQKFYFTEEEKTEYKKEIDNYCHLILLFILIFEQNISFNEVISMFLYDSKKINGIFVDRQLGLELTEKEKENILEKAKLLNESIDSDVVLFYKRARKVIANILGSEYEDLMPVYDELNLVN